MIPVEQHDLKVENRVLVKIFRDFPAKNIKILNATNKPDCSVIYKIDNSS